MYAISYMWIMSLVYDHIILPVSESKRYLDEAMQQGYVLADLAKCLLEGPAGAGKSSLKLLLFNRPPPTLRSSTGCLERPIRAVSGVRVETSKDDWHELSEDELATMLADMIPLLCDQIACGEELSPELIEALKPLLANEKQKASTDMQEGTPTATLQPEATSTDSRDPKAASVQNPQPESTSTHAEPATNDTSPDAPKAAKSASTPVEQATRAILEKIRNRISSGEEEAGEILCIGLVHFIDSGGQPPFHEVIPIFSKHTSVAVLVFRLSEELGARPLVEYYDACGHRIGMPHPSPLTCEEMVKVMARSLQSSPTDGKPPKVIVVGTHKDKEHECPDETRQQKNEKLCSILCPVMQDELIFSGDAMNQLIFPVNTKEPGEEEREIAAVLRRKIEKCSRKVKIPIWWFIFEMILRKLAELLGRRVLSRQECLQVAHTLSFHDKAFDAAITFFHRLNVVLYYPDILPNVIFTDSQVPLDKISELVQRSYELRAAKQGKQEQQACKAIDGKWARFRDQGIIAFEFLGEFPKHYKDGLFTPADLVKLLEAVLILAPISKDEYFMPCLLEMLPPAELDKHRVSSGPASPLLIRFPNGWPRCGVYCCLVVFLLNKCQWQVVHPNGAPILISRNCIKFQLPNTPCIVTLIDSFSHFELHVTAPPPVCYSICPSIKDTVLAGIDAASDNLHYNNAKPTVSMFCPHSSDNTPVQPSTTPHAAVVKGYPWWVCSENVAVFGELSDQQKVWFSPAEKRSTEGEMVISVFPFSLPTFLHVTILVKS